MEPKTGQTSAVPAAFKAHGRAEKIARVKPAHLTAGLKKIFTFLLFNINRLCTGGDGGIRTLDTLERYDDLANRCLQPLGHVSSASVARHARAYIAPALSNATGTASVWAVFSQPIRLTRKTKGFAILEAILCAIDDLARAISMSRIDLWSRPV